ncbi:hypothetical protein H2203_008760 [Taxawa tesnikishii (nom. ined.)]|nr:hypothetical protein H2203_008760 [Dothideales sp. JES 119]
MFLALRMLHFLATAFYFKKTSLVTDLRENGQPINNYNGNCTGLSEGVIADVEAVAENGFLKEFYGPFLRRGDNFTSVVRLDPSDVTDNQLAVDGHGELAKSIPCQSFPPKDITLLQDGERGSTCTILSETMKTNRLVQSIAFGGRASHGPIQAVGGIKGSQTMPWSSLVSIIRGGLALATPDLKAKLDTILTPSRLSNINQTLLRSGNSNAGLNFQNQIRQGDESRAPLQFVYEAADCRIWYTSEIYAD